MNNQPATLTADEVKYIVQDAISYTYGTTRKLDAFDGSPGSDVVRWLEEFEYYALANKWSEEAKKAKLPLYLTRSAKDWYNVYVASKAHISWDELKEKLNEYFLPTD